MSDKPAKKKVRKRKLYTKFNKERDETDSLSSSSETTSSEVDDLDGLVQQGKRVKRIVDDTVHSEDELKEHPLVKNGKGVIMPVSDISMLRTKSTIYKNILSYNIDSFNEGNPDVVFLDYDAIHEETPAGILMQHDTPKYDIFISSDEDDELEEFDNDFKTIPIGEFVLSKRIIP